MSKGKALVASGDVIRFKHHLLANSISPLQGLLGLWVSCDSGGRRTGRGCVNGCAGGNLGGEDARVVNGRSLAPDLGAFRWERRGV